MNYAEIQDKLRELSMASYKVEQAYIDNGGEVTEETEALEAQKAAIRAFLEDEGAVDALGRWHKAKEDELATFKAEKAAAEARIKAAQNSLDFIKAKVAEVLRAIGKEKVKGTYYSYAQATSTKNSVMTEALDDAYLDMVTEAARNAGLPAGIDVALKTNVTRLQESGLPQFINEEQTQTSKFTKPRKPKEDN